MGDDQRLEELELDAQRQGALQEVTAGLSSAGTRNEILHAILDEGGRVLGSSAAVAYLLAPDGASLELAAHQGITEALAETLQGLPAAANYPVARCIAEERPVWISDRATLERDFPDLAEQPLSPGASRAMVALPLRVGGRMVGGLGFAFPATHSFDAGEREFLVTLSERCAAAMERAQLYEQSQQARAAAERSRAEVESLYQLADSANQLSTPEEVFEVALGALKPALGVERAAILVVDEDGVLRSRAARGLSDAYSAAIQGHPLWAGSWRDAAPLSIADVELASELSEHRGLMAKEGIRSLAVVPLLNAGAVMGALVMCWTMPHQFSEHEVKLATSIGAQVGASIARARSERERERLIADLSSTLRFNEVVSGILAHDLKNPLAAVLMNARMLQTSDVERTRTVAGRIITSGERMSRMIDQILEWTRVRQGVSHIQLTRSDCDLRAVTDEVVAELQARKSDSTITVESRGDVRGSWDADRLAQVLSNLVGNALDHAAAPGVSVSLVGSDDAVRLSVSNKGHIPDELLPTIFQPFRGAHTGRHSGARGLGLGLFITQQIVLAHGGRVETETPSEGWLAFVVTLPKRSPV